MSRKEAAMILGIPLNAKPNKIKEAHKRIMIANHPDRGSYFIIIVFLTQFFVFKVFMVFFSLETLYDNEKSGTFS